MYQMKITQKVYLMATKYLTRLCMYDTETGEIIDRYKRTFNPDTGEIEEGGLPEFVEDRLFEPALWVAVMHFTVRPNGYANQDTYQSWLYTQVTRLVLCEYKRQCILW